MAISDMRKLTAVAMSSTVDSLISSLQKLKCVEISKKDNMPSGDPGYSEVISGVSDIDTSYDIEKCDSKINDAEKAITFLSMNSKKSLFKIGGLEEISIDDFGTERSGKAAAAVHYVLETYEALENSEKKLDMLTAKYESYRAWEHYSFQMPVQRTEDVIIVAGAIPSTVDLLSLDSALEDLRSGYEVISSTPESRAISLVIYNEDYQESMRIFSTFGFVQTNLRVSADKNVDSILDECGRQVSETVDEISEIKKSAEKLSDKVTLIQYYRDWLVSQKNRFSAKSRMLESDRTTVIFAWVPKQAENKIEKTLESAGAAYEFADPDENDDPPVVLMNNKFSASFEPVLKLYSLPKYGSFDPMNIMSVFYMLIFGLMFADVGYGFVVTAVCLLALKLLKPRGNLRQFLKMFVWCGIAMMICGVIFGGYFGDLPVQIAKNFNGNANATSPALWFDMVADPMTFLILTVVVGCVHLFAGLCIEFYLQIRSKHVFAAIFDTGSWMLLFIGAAVYILAGKVGIYIVLTAVAMLVLTQGRHEKNILMKFLKGIISLYGIVNYLSDILSYTRILALGLASAVIASVVNVLATMNGTSVGGIIFFILLMLVGHLLNLAVNMLGSFVHDSRLQYIEFFGKFYEDGGRPFEPLEPEEKYVVFK